MQGAHRKLNPVVCAGLPHQPAHMRLHRAFFYAKLIGNLAVGARLQNVVENLLLPIGQVRVGSGGPRIWNLEQPVDQLGK